MGYFLQLLGVPLVLVGFFMVGNGILSYWYAVDRSTFFIDAVCGGVGLLVLLLGFAFLREGRRKLRRLISETRRCDSVRSAVQDQKEGWSGSVHTEAVWHVFCSPGLSYEVRFDPDGQLLALTAR